MQIAAQLAISGVVCEFGLTRLFGSADIGTNGLGEGWSACEDGHNWNDGLDAKLTLWTASLPIDPAILALEGLPYLATGVSRQSICLFVNGHRLGFWRLTENRPHTLRAVVEPEYWLKRRDGGLLNLVWHLEDSVKPIDIGDAEDHRQLGFCFQTLTLESQAA